MAIIAGIDEAGYGPLLGPLVVAHAALRVPDAWEDLEARPACLWTRLPRDLAREAPRPSRRPVAAAAAPSAPPAAPPLPPLAVGDSKALYQAGKGLQWLEEATLAFRTLAAEAGAQGAPSARPGGARGAARRGKGLPGTALPFVPSDPSLGALLADAGIDAEARGASPWLAHEGPPLPVRLEPDALTRRLAGLRAALARERVEPLALHARVLEPAAFNAGCEREGNKHRLEGTIVGAALARLFLAHGAEGVDATCDRLSGRAFYADLLESAIPGARVRVLEEGKGASSYLVTKGRRRLRVRFLVGGDAARFEVALASCCAKYLRELVMERLNAFCAAIAPGIRPTAGYAQDGRRFLEEIAPAWARAQVRVPLSALERRW